MPSMPTAEAIAPAHPITSKAARVDGWSGRVSNWTKRMLRTTTKGNIEAQMDTVMIDQPEIRGIGSGPLRGLSRSIVACRVSSIESPHSGQTPERGWPLRT